MFYLTIHSKHFYLRLYSVGHMVKHHSDSERETHFKTLQFYMCDTLNYSVLLFSFSFVFLFVRVSVTVQTT